MKAPRPTLLPTRATFAVGEPVGLEVDGPVPADAEISVWRLGERIAVQPATASAVQELAPLPTGGYGVELAWADGVVRTAVEVTDRPRARLRYGFIANYRPGKDVDAVTRLARRLHLNGIQFYDWAYRHADLLGGGPRYDDALGQPVDLEVVRQLVLALREAGTASYGYAAVYGVGPQEWDQWQDLALLTASGAPYGLGDFLSLVDPSAPRWLAHFGRDLQDSVAQVGFDGFHLDQYGYPKFATRPDGEFVDMARAFMDLVAGVRAALPDARLVFNNVNDFPTWNTGTAPQDAVYIEPWEPLLTLGDLATTAVRARAVSGDLPVVLAAYQSVYAEIADGEADLVAAFTMATLYSHGATQLLAGESSHVLVDPYYVRNHQASSATVDFLARWYDFLVEHDELLMDPRVVDVTATLVGAHNGDLDVSFDGAMASHVATPGMVWRRVTRAGDGLVVHLINLVGQDDCLWDARRQKPIPVGGGTLTFRHVHGRTPRVRVADPDGAGRLVDLDTIVGGDVARATLPPLNIWQVVHVNL